MEVLEGRWLPSTVTNLYDSGPGSLRDAIANTPVGGTVDFQTGLTGSIILTSGELVISHNLTIDGPGPDVITVSGNGASRVFHITAGRVDISGLTISDGAVTISSGSRGGGIENAGHLTVTSCAVVGNSVEAPFFEGGSASGGGIYNSGTLTVADSTVSGNSVVGGEATGGGIYNARTLTVDSSTLAGNSVASGTGSVGTFGEGGGIQNVGTATVVNSTLSGNSATGSPQPGGEGRGGAIYNGTSLTVTNSTLSGNSAGGPVQHAGGLFGRATLHDTLIARNMAAQSPDVSGVMISQGHNLIGDGTGGSGFSSSDQVGSSGHPVDPKLGPLQDNGGPALTMALLPSSPAIDAGDNTGAPEFDQRGPGFPRISNGIIDIGAFEVQVESFVVTSTDDAGPGSLRQTILNADAGVGAVTITFAIPGSGVQTIHLASPLPAITNTVMLDGTSQPGYAGQPLIVLDGAGAGAGADGLTITAAGSMVKGLAVDGFDAAGIHLEGPGADVLAADYLGTDATGTRAQGNGVGIFIDNTSDNTIGGTVAGAENLISGNRQAGLAISGSHNVVQGNMIGTDLTGTLALGNGTGVAVISPGTGNTIGGTVTGARNLISGNVGDGLLIELGASGSFIQNNYIGIDFGGTVAVSNGGNGITIQGIENLVGGNLIGGNGLAGIALGGSGNQVQGNTIGADVTGAAALPNSVGVSISGMTNIVGGTVAGARNLISGNGTGVTFTDQASRNQVSGNYIGTDSTGTHALPNVTGVFADPAFATSQNTIGGEFAGAGNLISGNTDAGLDLGGAGDDIEANDIGTNAAGTRALPNGVGVILRGMGQALGGFVVADRNLIAGNTGDGVQILGTGAAIRGNLIGTDLGGTLALGNGDGVRFGLGAVANTLGGSAPGARNVISGNATFGVALTDPADVGNLLEGNFIGTDITGTRALPNEDGILLTSGSGNTVGGTAVGAGNLIAANPGSGLAITASGNTVQGNRIGTDVSGTLALGNGTGISISGTDNTVGGMAAGARNLVAGNTTGIDLAGPGATGNLIEGNWIGTDAKGTRALPNVTGLRVGGVGNTVGGTTPEAGNLIAGNRQVGVTISGSNNVLEGNRIGTDLTGTLALGNGTSVSVVFPGTANTIGGTVAGAGNLLSGNVGDGLVIDVGVSGGLVQGNRIGTDLGGTLAVANGGNGITINGTRNTVGGTTPGAGNLIAGNTLDGIALGGAQNQVQGNTIGTNADRTAVLANRNGILVLGSINTIGAAAAAGRNVIAGSRGDGVVFNAGADANLLQGNVIAANGGNGVTIAAGAADNVLVGNAIGTTPASDRAYPNGLSGVVVLGANNTIGGTTTGAGSVISANTLAGLLFSGGGARENLVEGNFIGTDAAGTTALGNGAGITLTGGAAGNTIGGLTAGAGNVIGGNHGDGLALRDNGTTANLVQGNFIGTDPTGTIDLGNGQSGVHLDHASGNTVGGTVAGAANTIANNSNDGVLVDTGTGDALRQNAIFNSGHLGIELLNGGNDNQAFPTLTSVTSDGSSTTIAGTLASAPDTTSTLEFFANDVCNPSGYGEGQAFLGSAAVTTDDTGATAFTVTLGVGVAAGQFVSATATDPAGNTSQFAACFAVLPTTFPGLMAADTRVVAVVAPMPSQPIPVPPAAEAVHEPLSRIDWYFSTLALDRGAFSRGATEASADTSARLVLPGTGRDRLEGPALSLPADGLDAGPLADLL